VGPNPNFNGWTRFGSGQDQPVAVAGGRPRLVSRPPRLRRGDTFLSLPVVPRGGSVFGRAIRC